MARPSLNLKQPTRLRGNLVRGLLRADQDSLGKKFRFDAVMYCVLSKPPAEQISGGRTSIITPQGFSVQ